MPDDRMFHKRLGHSAKVTMLTDLEDLVWRQYVLSADDFGVLRFSAVTLQADNDRFAKRPQKVIQRALERVRDIGLIRTFDHQGRTYCFQGDWMNYQRIKHPRQTINPRPPDDMLEACTPATQKLFRDWPGRTTKKLDEDCGNSSEEFPPLACAGTRETANTNGQRLTADGKQGGAGGKSTVPASKVAFDGSRLKVWAWQHEDLGRRLGEKAENFDLIGWYPRLNRELETTGESYADPWKWLQERLYRDAELPLPNLMGRSKTAGNKAALAQFLARGQG